jgi:hypothetical protein
VRAESGTGVVHQGDRVGGCLVLGAAHQPGDGRSSIRVRPKVLAETGVNQHARQCARLDPELVSLPGECRVIGLVETDSDGPAHAAMIAARRCKLMQIASGT